MPCCPAGDIVAMSQVLAGEHRTVGSTVPARQSVMSRGLSTDAALLPGAATAT